MLKRIFGLCARLSVAPQVLRKLLALDASLAQHRKHVQVETFMQWIAHATLRTSPLISIVLATRDRRAFLARAIASVKQQSYRNWELLVVNDGSVDDTSDLLAADDDARLRSFKAGGVGVCGARNVALAEVRGELVAYLDDDNIMHPDWLKSVAWAFEQRPEATILYGAFVVDDPARINPVRSGDLPQLFFWPYDHQAAAKDNVADISCIAHRAGLPEARFDETLLEMGDWDLLLRLTRSAPPVVLPAIACFYTTDAPNRLSHGPNHEADLIAVRTRNQR
jgi:glycosyltransferase involved in cell wall biosynthesis